MRMRIYLVPQLNVLTVEFENKIFNTDDILTEMQLNEGGKQISLKDLSSIKADSNERLYEWLHNWAGLYLDI